MTVGESITKYRKEDGLTQKQLAERLYVSPDLVSKWERGDRRPDYAAVLKMSELFGVDPDSLIDRETAVAGELRKVIPDFIEKDDLTGCINSFLSELTDRERVIFVSRYNLFLDTKTIADRTGTGDGYIRNTLARIRRKLKKYLRRTKQ
ncbi:MAG: helix-turn-helix transcriptional regulator [Clostridia bacterium]|nr:helix-turn-helix transcriptional regulator [Clostridia bacterium]